MQSKYILHYGLIAGLSHPNALALRRLGAESYNILPVYDDSRATSLDHYDRQLPFDRALTSRNSTKVWQLFRRSLFCLHVIRHCSLVHYYCRCILPGGLDSALFARAGLPMIISWAGGDARICSMARAKNPYCYLDPDPERDRQTRRRLGQISKHVRFVATDPEMEEYGRPHFERTFMVRQPIDLTQCFYNPGQQSGHPPAVLHIPTWPKAKGTAYIKAAVERLQTEGLQFEFRCLEPKLTQKQVRQEIARADIYVDELRCGAYGVTCVESLATGKPTFTYIREDLKERYPADLPVVNANPDTVYAKLKELIKDREQREEIGRKSRLYAEKYHSLEAVGKSLLDIYREIGWKEKPSGTDSSAR